MIEQLYHIPTDKLLHIIIGMILCIAILEFIKSLNIKLKYPLLFMLTFMVWVGVIKESYDILFKSGGYWDNIDLLYGVIGGIIPIGIKKILKFATKSL